MVLLLTTGEARGWLVVALFSFACEWAAHIACWPPAAAAAAASCLHFASSLACIS